MKIRKYTFFISDETEDLFDKDMAWIIDNVDVEEVEKNED